MLLSSSLVAVTWPLSNSSIDGKLDIVVKLAATRTGVREPIYRTFTDIYKNLFTELSRTGIPKVEHLKLQINHMHRKIEYAYIL